MVATARTLAVRSTATWTAGTFLALPIAGYLGTAVVGRVDNSISALAGGALVGAIVGLGQALGSSRRLNVLAWTAATTVGLSVGTLLGTLAVDFRTTLPDLALRGLIAGTVLGLAQVLALPRRTRLRWVWVPAVAVLTSLAWTVTTLAGIDVDQQFITFGAGGAIVYAFLSGITLLAILPATTAASRRSNAELAGRR
jgi:hypothetical protein